MDKGRIVADPRRDEIKDRRTRSGEMAGAVNSHQKEETGHELVRHSVMAKKGVAQGERGNAHTIGIEDQGTFHYVYGPYVNPVLEVEPGAIVTVETHDAFEGKITSEATSPSEILNFPFLNPQTGPIFVRGAEKGDVWPCASSRSSRAARSRWAPPASSPSSAGWSAPGTPRC
jgi:hypothetical protein